MENVVKTVKGAISGLFAVLTSVIGLLVLAHRWCSVKQPG